MKNAGAGLERILAGLTTVERLIGHMEQRQTEKHLKNAAKECLLASRSVIDSLIDTLEEEQRQPVARNIKIKDE